MAEGSEREISSQKDGVFTVGEDWNHPLAGSSIRVKPIAVVLPVECIKPTVARYALAKCGSKFQLQISIVALTEISREFQGDKRSRFEDARKVFAVNARTKHELRKEAVPYVIILGCGELNPGIHMHHTDWQEAVADCTFFSADTPSSVPK